MIRIVLLLLASFAVSAFAIDTPVASAAEIVHFQCKDWKAKHIHDAKKAETISQTLKKLGCEVKQADHDGHYDVKYRCVKEKQLPVKSHAEAVKWEKWFKEYGFKAYHTH